MSSMTMEKMNEFAKKISDDVRISEEEGQKVIDELLEQIKNSRKSLNELITKLINETMIQLDVPTRAEFNDLERKFSELQNSIQSKQTDRQ